MLSAQGLCRTFDASADGYVRGEGCGVVVLRRLSAALEAGDEILAVIRGSAVNQDGRSNGLTAPSGRAQQEVVRRALSVAGVAGADVGYVEAHGTGTPLGDPIEVRALGRVLGEGRVAGSSVALGSVKTNIGHLEAAAGIAGFIKAVLVVQRGEIPPHLHLVDPNPHVAWGELPVSVPTVLTPWPAERRVAGVSAFGFGGTNAHVVLEAPPARTDTPFALPAGPVLVKVSGQGLAAVRASAARLAAFVAEAEGVTPAEVAWSAGVGRADLSDRAAVVATTREELIQGLLAVAAGASSSGVLTGRREAGSVPQVGFVIPGSHIPVAELYGRVAAVTETVDAVAAALELTASELLSGPESIAAYAAAVALGAWWRSVGVEPDVIVGHGLGMYAAAVLAGVFSVGDGARLVAADESPESALKTIRLRIPTVDLYSDASSGRPLGPEVATAKYWTHPRAAKPLDETLTALCASGTRIILELGTGDLLGDPAPEVLHLPSTAEGSAAYPCLLESLARLWADGREVVWAAVNLRLPRSIKLPRYPFQGRHLWLDDAYRPAFTRTGRALRPAILETATGEVIGETELSLASMPFLSEHRVHGRLVVPGVVYLELVLRCAERAFGGPVQVADLSISRPLVLSDQDVRTVQVVLSPTVDGTSEACVYSKDPVAGWQPHLSALIIAEQDGPARAVLPEQAFLTAGSDCCESLTGGEFYERAWHPSFQLGPSFQLIRSAERGPRVAVGKLVPPAPRALGVTTGIRPELLLLDACVQLVAFAGHPESAEESDRPVELGTGYERMAVHRPITSDEVWCTVVVRDSTEGMLVGDLRLTDEDGLLVAEISGVSFRPITPAMLERLVSVVVDPRTSSVLDLDALRASVPEERRCRTVDYLVRLLASILGSAPVEVEPGTLVTTVADSLMIAELKASVDRDFEVKLPMEVIFEGDRLADIAEWIVQEVAILSEQLQVADTASAAATETATDTNTATDTSAKTATATGTATRTPARQRPLGGRRAKPMSVAEMLAKADLDPGITAVLPPEPPEIAPQDVLLTGATGYVGAFLLAELLAKRRGAVHCLVRAENAAHASRRLLANLATYGIELAPEDQERIVPLLGDLTKPLFGLDAAGFSDLHGRIGAIFHCGATVKWTYPFSGLEAANVDGTREVLRLATAGPARGVNFISTVGVFSSKEFTADTVTESDDLLTSGPLVVGYAQTKWVAEQMVRTAHERGVPVTIHRINTGAHSVSGAFNRLDHLSMVIRGCAEAGIAPDHVEIPLQPAPIDYVARAIVDLAGRPELSGRTFHLVNDQKLSWIQFFDMVEEFGFPMERMTFAAWKDKVTSRESGTMALLGLVPFLNDSVDDVRLPRSLSEETQTALAGTGITCPPLDSALIRNYLNSFISSGFMEPPKAGWPAG
jgi:thioester reductase-like protein